MSEIKIYNCDCLPFMKKCKDKQFDLAIVDPPYGTRMNVGRNNQNNNKNWDNEIPTKEYFNELFKVSKKYIIWGGNYFSHYIPANRCFIYWDKPNIEHLPTMADGELALTNLDTNAKKYRVTSALHNGKKIHPTQKPVQLYEWLLMNYAKKEDKIFDSHLGSGSIAIACHNLGFDLTACEIDKEYYDAALQRFEIHKQQLRLFQDN